MNKLFIKTDLLEKSSNVDTEVIKEFVTKTSTTIEKILKEFNIPVKLANVDKGPTITRFEYNVKPTINLDKLENVSDNLKLALAVPSVRILAPVPSRPYIGVEIPNKTREIVRMRDILEDHSEISGKKLPIYLGKDITGNIIIKDLADAPHLLIAGATGSGKSVCVNSVITSLLYTKTPDEVRFVMVDPKRVELSVYRDIPHLITPVITESLTAVDVLDFLVKEMEVRYQCLEYEGARSLESYNNICDEKLPYIVVVIDEFADLMMMKEKKEIEQKISKLAAMARAVGIHLILATQRPSVDVITGVIKSNFPTRIAFKVASGVDSDVILSERGAEKLLGKGDMLWSEPSLDHTMRIQGIFLSDKEVNVIANEVREAGIPRYIDINNFHEEEKSDVEEVVDELYNEALKVTSKYGNFTTACIQRNLKVSWERASSILEMILKNNPNAMAHKQKIKESLFRK